MTKEELSNYLKMCVVIKDKIDEAIYRVYYKEQQAKEKVNENTRKW